ncbi:nicotinate (nicotinamide) nucleotide adenylyltransferase [Rhodothermus profundi]|uniref:Probable nicotinate-nucleotide adenylyltransferase n=1 Tax=Rhodothermus profundi TaxID=633813 RepID=A0A1M6TC10_9BACT|nr:nicotinate (nicotinamide) nucleotide adenylyltransferase [Rhodothermus profundi]SHK54582.1 nicotinate-nucleotide adenylyltransferase [Rhodothermus profundi]
MARRRVGLFGGSFNPPHLAHLIIAELVCEQAHLDQVLWIPCYSPPHKDERELAAPHHRLAMVRLAIEGNPFFAVSDVEIRRGGRSYTIDTIRELQAQHPDWEFLLILGEDSLRTFHTWRAPEEIVQRVPLLVYRRPGVSAYPVAPRFLARTTFVEAPLLEISATEVRQRCRQGRSIRYLVPEAVRQYILENHLYGALVR